MDYEDDDKMWGELWFFWKSGRIPEICFQPSNYLRSTYLEQDEQMRTALKYAIEPVVDTEELLNFLHSFGDWIINAAENWLEQYNPAKEINLALET